jgi:subtilisin family serine protease
MPTEGHSVIDVGSVGPSTNKADYSNWGAERTDVTAPGGFFRDFPGTPQNRTVGNLILSAYPQSIAIANGDLNADGTPNNDFVVEDCQRGTCAYYQYLQGTSMASPHAVGVAALIVSRFGRPTFRGGLGLDPDTVESIMKRTATDHPCPTPPTIVYPDRGPEFTATCTGTTANNSIWGEGIVDALAAVSQRH